MVLSFEFTGFFLSRPWASVDDDEPASRVKRPERPIQNGPGMREFVVSIRHENRIYPPFCQMWVIRLTVDNVDVTLMAQKCSDPQKRQWLFENVLRKNATFLANYRRQLQGEVSRPRTDIGHDVAVFQVERLNDFTSSLPAVAVTLGDAQHSQRLNDLISHEQYNDREADNQKEKRHAHAVSALNSTIRYCHFYLSTFSPLVCQLLGRVVRICVLATAVDRPACEGESVNW